jgi:hypothetical protein
MAMHLGRHMATTHGAKRTRKAVKRRPRQEARMLVRAQAGGPAQLLHGVRVWRDALAAQQTQLASQVEALDQLLATLGGTVPKPRGQRALKGRRTGGGRERARPGSLRSFVAQVLRAARKPLRRTEIAAAVLKAGYKTRNKTLGKSVGVMLRNMAGVKKMGRGVYRAP